MLADLEVWSESRFLLLLTSTSTLFSQNNAVFILFYHIYMNPFSVLILLSEPQ